MQPMQKYYAYLEELCKSGETNMYGAAPYLERQFPELSAAQAKEVLILWIESFNEEEKP